MGAEALAPGEKLEPESGGALPLDMLPPSGLGAWLAIMGGRFGESIVICSATSSGANRFSSGLARAAVGLPPGSDGPTIL